MDRNKKGSQAEEMRNLLYSYMSLAQKFLCVCVCVLCYLFVKSSHEIESNLEKNYQL